MAYTNLPGIFTNIQDGNLLTSTANNNPIVMVIGTASQGPSEQVFTVETVSDAANTFGKTSGTLARGLYEAVIAGAVNMRLFRIGATPAILASVGTGLTIETVSKDDSSGDDYDLFYDDSEKRLRVYRVSDGELVYDNYPAYPLQAVDLGEVAVTGTATTGPGDIGTLAAHVTLADANGVSGASYTAGTDGLTLSRMKMYEALYNAYELLADQRMDVVIPMNVYLDDLNVMDLTPAQIVTRNLAALADYPSVGDADDVLGKLYVEEYQGVNYFWWWFPVDPVSPTFAAANIFPTAGSASATLKTDGTALTADDFHEVNFAYQLADFLYTQSRDNAEMTGTIGVLPPVSYALKHVSQWIGKLPTTETDANGNVVVQDSPVGNGSGLLGNKFMSGRIGSATITPFTIDGIAGLYNGGFIATDTGFLDGTHLKDNNDHLIDIGKYISVVASYPVLANPSRTVSYTSTGAATYGGFYSNLPADSAPTNKLLGNIRLPYRINSAKLDQLAGQRYVTFHAKTKGIVVSDAPTAARPDSDYQRLSTQRQVKAAVDAVRRVGEPFLGEGLTAARVAALDTAVDGALKALVKQGVLQRYEATTTSTPSQKVLGQATVQLKLVPAFELRQITVVVALAAV